MDSLSFFQSLYGRADGWLALWRSDTKATAWVKPGDRGAIESFVESANETPFNAYFSVCLQRERAAKGRGNEAGVSLMPAIWVDVDFASKDDAKRTYPTREQAELALESLPLKPSIVLKTGGGIHAYWLLKSPLVVDDRNREQAKAAVQNWQRKLRAFLLKRCGAALDSTHDLARVMRIPGTANVKSSDSKPVELDEAFPVDDPPVRYDFGQFLAESPAVEPSSPAKRAERPQQVAKRLLASPVAEPPADRLANLIDADQKFARSWNNQRTEFKSPSEYDLSLATFAFNAGWSDEQISALLLAFARRFYPDRIEKILRVTGGVQDYLELTLRSAKRKTYGDSQENEAREAIGELVDHVETAAMTGTPADRDTVFPLVSKMLGIQVVGFRQTGERDEVFELIVVHAGKRKAVEIGGADKIHGSPKRLVERLLAGCQHYVAISKDLRAKWSGIVRALFSVVEFVEVAETTTEQRVRSLIEELIQRNHGAKRVLTAEHRQASALDGRPYIEGEELFIFGPSLKRLAAEIDKAIAGGDLYVGLRSLGFTQTTVQIPAKKTSRSFWSIEASAFGLASESVDLMSEPIE